jgi:hypothetical protein
MNQLEQVVCTATAHTMSSRDGASQSDRRSFLTFSAAAGNFCLFLGPLLGLLLIAAPSYTRP